MSPGKMIALRWLGAAAPEAPIPCLVTVIWLVNQLIPIPLKNSAGRQSSGNWIKSIVDSVNRIKAEAEAEVEPRPGSRTSASHLSKQNKVNQSKTKQNFAKKTKPKLELQRGDPAKIAG